MDDLLACLSAAADPTRLRLLALAARGAFCVTDFCEILGQSQPRLSRHLRLLCEAGLLDRSREGASAWFTLAQHGARAGRHEDGGPSALIRDILRRAPEADPLLAADRRGAARVLAERARAASEKFRRQGADWDEMRALALPADAVETRLLELLPRHLGRLLDVGTGTGRLLEVLAPRVRAGLGVDASRTMLALARVRLASPEFSHCSVRLADMYALPIADGSFDVVLLQMVLHYAEEPASALAEARRVLAPHGVLVVVDLAPHARTALMTQMGHRTPGFSDANMQALLRGAGLVSGPPACVGQACVGQASDGQASDGQQSHGELQVRIWQAAMPAYAARPLLDEAVS